MGREGEGGCKFMFIFRRTVKNKSIKKGVWVPKTEHFEGRKGNGNHICDPPPLYGIINEILTPPPPFSDDFVS